MSANPFATEQAWDVGGGFLGKGDHICEVLEIDGSPTQTSSGGHPQIEVKVGNGDGEIKDWIVVKENTIGKVVQLTDACGVERPTDAQVRPEGTGYRLDPAYLATLVGKKVGVIVREEPNKLDPTAPPRDRVKGFVPVHKIKAPADIPVDTSGYAPTEAFGATFPSAVANAEDDIPF